MSFTGKWMEIETTVLSDRSLTKILNIRWFLSLKKILKVKYKKSQKEGKIGGERDFGNEGGNKGSKRKKD